MTRYHIAVTGVMLIISAVLPDLAQAHRLIVFGWTEGNTVFVQSKFSGGKKVNTGDVTIFDTEGTQLLTGKTDEYGEFSFEIPKKTDLKIVVNAGAGHQGEWTIPVTELDDGDAAPLSGQPLTADSTKPEDAPDPEKNMIASDEIEAVVEKVLERKLKPVMKMLSEQQKSGPSFTDIIGGIGYILGLVGLAAYISFRKRNLSE